MLIFEDIFVFVKNIVCPAYFPFRLMNTSVQYLVVENTLKRILLRVYEAKFFKYFTFCIQKPL